MSEDAAMNDAPILPGAEELARTGIFGTAEATILGKKAAISHFNAFLSFEARTSNGAHVKFSHLGECDACELARLQRFATYLMTIARDDRGDLLRPGTCLQYFSGAIILLNE